MEVGLYNEDMQSPLPRRCLHQKIRRFMLKLTKYISLHGIPSNLCRPIINEIQEQWKSMDVHGILNLEVPNTHWQMHYMVSSSFVRCPLIFLIAAIIAFATILKPCCMAYGCWGGRCCTITPILLLLLLGNQMFPSPSA